jgi:hypothetical protein
MSGLGGVNNTLAVSLCKDAVDLLDLMDFMDGRGS